MSALSQVNHQLESRVRENRMHGSEGGGAGVTTGSPYPYNGGAIVARASSPAISDPCQTMSHRRGRRVVARDDTDPARTMVAGC